jgi:hypothetical protein
MKGAIFAVAALVALLVLLRARSNLKSTFQPNTTETGTNAQARSPHPSFLYGRVRTLDGSTYEGRIRWGREEEAFWDDYFNGVRKRNRWVDHVPPERLPKRSDPITIFGLEIANRDRPISPGKTFLAAFGDIARIDARGTDVQVNLKSGTAFLLARSEASDLDDGLRVWDRDRGVVDLDSLRIQSIQLLESPEQGAATPDRLFGTVHAIGGKCTGFLTWEREQSLGADELVVGDVRLRFETVQSIQRTSGGAAVATLSDGQKIRLASGWLSGRGIYVDDPRYGRVLVSREAVQSVQFSRTATSGHAYGDFPVGRPLTGTVTRHHGRLV